MATMVLTGCVTIYQPMSGLQRSVALDPRAPNLEGLTLELRCLPSDYLDDSGANLLCDRLEQLFTNQGATVRSAIDIAEIEPEEGVDAKPADLRVDLVARQTHIQKNTLLWILSFASLTLIPARSEYTFEQTVTIRDATGFLLVTDTLEARFIRYFGSIYWGLNWILDRAVRERADKVTGDAISEDFSRDYYAQLSQLVFNARTRLDVVAESPAGR